MCYGFYAQTKSVPLELIAPAQTEDKLDLLTKYNTCIKMVQIPVAMVLILWLPCL